jgi:DNA polymerase elongation subunit (family B)
MSLLEDESDADRLPALVPGAIALTRSFLDDLDAERVLLQDLVCQTKLSREPHEYKGNSTSAKAARQLANEGKYPRVGQRVKFIYTHGEKTSIRAWDMGPELDYSLVNKSRYRELLLRAVHQILEPLGLEEDDLISLVHKNRRQLPIWSHEEFGEDDDFEKRLVIDFEES